MRNDRTSPWDKPGRVAKLHELWAAGLSTVQIAIALGLGPEGKNAVIGRKNRDDLPARPSPIRPRDGSAYVAPPKQPGAWEMALARAEQRRREVVHSEQQIALPLAIPVERFAVMPPAWRTPAPAPRLMAFGAEGCRFIAAEPRGRHTIFCDAVRQEGSAYCPSHHAVCWTQRVRRQDAAAAG